MDAAVAFALASDLAAVAAARPADAVAASGDFCRSVEAILHGLLAQKESWSRRDWLDGFVATAVSVRSGRLVVQGGVWINAVRVEPCEVELELAGGPERAAIIRFLDAAGPSRAKDCWKIEFPRERWLHEFVVRSSMPREDKG